MPKKSLPHDLEAERAVFGSILLGGNSVYEKAVGWIRDPDAFYKTGNQHIWRAMSKLYNDNVPIDTITLTSLLKDEKLLEVSGGYYTITGLIEVLPTAINIEAYSRLVWEKYVQRMTAITAQKLYQESHKEYKDVVKLIDQHRIWIDELQSIQPTKAKGIDVILDESVASIQERSNLIKFNIPALDYPAGGMTRKEITVIGGRPGHGKSLLILNVTASLLKQGYKVMLINREMTNEETIKRMIVMESSELTHTGVRKMDLTKEEMTSLKKTSKGLKQTYDNLIMFDTLRTMEEVVIEVNRHKPDVIIDDYIQLIDADTKKDRRFQIESILREYKWMVKRNNCSAILVSQLSREIEKRQSPRPRLSDYAESGVIEQIAETAVFVFYHYNFDENEDRYQSEIIVAKARYGQIGTFVVGFNGDRCKFYSKREYAFEDDIKR